MANAKNSLSILVPTTTSRAAPSDARQYRGADLACPDNLEVLVSDDCSKDDTRSVLAEYQARMPYLRVFHQEVNLQARNWEFLLNQAQGDLVYLLCHDDAMAPDFLETYLGHFDADPELDMVFGDLQLRGPNSRSSPRCRSTRPPRGWPTA